MTKAKPKIHYAVSIRVAFYAWACYVIHGYIFEKWAMENMHATTDKNKVTCGNCRRTKDWKETK